MTMVQTSAKRDRKGRLKTGGGDLCVSFMLNNSDVAVHGGGLVRDVSFELALLSGIYLWKGNSPAASYITHKFSVHANIAHLSIS